MTEQPTKLEILIDASFLKNSACSLHNFYTLIEGYSYLSVTNDIQFGSAFHHFAAEIFRSKNDFGKSLTEAKLIQSRPCETRYGKDYLNNPAYLATVCTDWLEWHEAKDNFEILEHASEPLVEKNFKLKLYEDDYVIVFLCGTIDKIGRFKNGPFGIGDYKTTATKDTEDFFTGFNLSVQLRTYIYAIQQYAILYPDSIWSQIANTPLVAFIDGIFLRSPSKGAMAEIKRSEIFQARYFNMDEYEYLLNKKVMQIVNMAKLWLKDKIMPMREGIINGSCMSGYVKCPYYTICMNAHNTVLQKAVINKNFVIRKYNPLMFGK